MFFCLAEYTVIFILYTLSESENDGCFQNETGQANVSDVYNFICEGQKQFNPPVISLIPLTHSMMTERPVGITDSLTVLPSIRGQEIHHEQRN